MCLGNLDKKERQPPKLDTPFHGIMSPLVCEAIKAVTCVNFGTNFVMFLGIGRIVSSYWEVSKGIRSKTKLNLTVPVQNSYGKSRPSQMDGSEWTKSKHEPSMVSSVRFMPSGTRSIECAIVRALSCSSSGRWSMS